MRSADGNKRFDARRESRNVAQRPARVEAAHAVREDVNLLVCIEAGQDLIREVASARDDAPDRRHVRSDHLRVELLAKMLCHTVEVLERSENTKTENAVCENDSHIIEE